MRFLLVLLIVLSLVPEQKVDTKAIVLGIAQDGGVPHLGCTQKICRTQHHFVSSLVVLDKQNAYLFDATPDLREQSRELISRMPQFTFSKNIYDAIFLTHAHMGHYSGLLFFGKESISSNEIPVYCSKEMSGYLTSNAPWNLLLSNKNVALRPFESEQSLSIGSLRITPVSVPHRKEFTDTHGYIIAGKSKSLLFIPDIDSWEPVKDRMKEWLSLCDYALLDGTFYSGDELPGRDITKVPHPTVLKSLEFFTTLLPVQARIYFTHFNHTNPLLDLESEPFKKVGRSPFGVASEWQEFPL